MVVFVEVAAKMYRYEEEGYGYGIVGGVVKATLYIAFLRYFYQIRSILAEIPAADLSFYLLNMMMKRG